MTRKQLADYVHRPQTITPSHTREIEVRVNDYELPEEAGS